MKVFLLIFVVFASATLATCHWSSSSSSSSSEESDESQAQAFMNGINLIFPSLAKRLAALRNYYQAFKAVNENNRLYDQGKVNFLQKVYPMNSMTSDQIIKSRTGLVVDPGMMRRKRSAPQGTANPLLCTNPPAAKNWFASGNVAPVQDQGQCGSCYVFAGVSALESAVSIKYGTPPLKLSEQELTDCIRQTPYGGCNGGVASWVWNPTKVDGGVVPAASYKAYTAVDTNGCNKNIAKAPNTIVDYYLTNPKTDEVALKCALNMYGPHAVSIDFSGPIQNYLSGIYDDPTANCNTAFFSNGSMVKPYNHAVSLVGYGSELNKAGVMTDYWLIKNSWGTWWGMNGFIKVARNKNNLCHIATSATVPILWSNTPTPTTKQQTTIPTAAPVAQCPACPAAMFPSTGAIDYWGLINDGGTYPATGVCTAKTRYIVTYGTVVKCCCR